MSIQISGCTVIDNSRNITNANNICVGVVTITGSSGNIETPGKITAGQIDFPISVLSFSPANNSIDQSTVTDIIITFDQEVQLGVGTITLREGSETGTIKESFNVQTSNKISINSSVVTITPDYYANGSLTKDTDIFLVIPSGAFKSVGGLAQVDFKGLNVAGGSAYKFKTIDAEFVSINPSAGSTNVSSTTNIILNFSKTPQLGIGTITLRVGSATSTNILQSYTVGVSTLVTVVGGGTSVTINTNNKLKNPLKEIFLVVPNTAILGYEGLNIVGVSTYSFFEDDLQLGDSYEGGFLISESGGTRWVVAPESTERSTTFFTSGNAVSAAGAATGCSGWFIPSCAQLLNPPGCCRQYWDSYKCAQYWGSTQGDPTGPFSSWTLNLASDPPSLGKPSNDSTHCARAFRCVSY